MVAHDGLISTSSKALQLLLLKLWIITVASEELANGVAMLVHIELLGCLQTRLVRQWCTLPWRLLLDLLLCLHARRRHGNTPSVHYKLIDLAIALHILANISSFLLA